MASMNNSVPWTCYLLLVILCVNHALGADDSTTSASTSILRKLAPTCEDLTCPREDDSDSYTECCVIDNEIAKCCSGTVAFHVNDSLVKVVGISVISTCIVLAILVLVCCFWSRCPLFNTCRVDYGQTDEVPYGAKEDHPLTAGEMPSTRANGPRGFAVSIRPVEEV